MLFKQIGFDDEEYMGVLEKIVRHGERLQNNPAKGLFPQEILVAQEILNYLGDELPGLSAKTYAYDVEGRRPNLIVRYKHPEAEASNATITFMGSHMDVVPAEKSQWLWDPFSLTGIPEGDDIKLQGRGTTDCLGHVALLSVMIKRLAQNKVKLAHEIVLVFISDEEMGHAKVGVYRLYENGLLSDLKNGPVYWVDTATNNGLFGPRIGTGGHAQWTLAVTGKEGHSGYPQLCINAIMVADQLMRYIDSRFREEFQSNEAQRFAKLYLFPTCSNCKRTYIQSSAPSKNIIPGHCILGGDVRFTPDFDTEKIKASLPRYVQEFDEKVRSGEYEEHGAEGGQLYVINENGEKEYAQFDFSWDADEIYKPFAADLESKAYLNILEAMKEIRGRVQPFSALGSLPLLYELSTGGFNLVPIGFGRQQAYHTPNEYCMLSDMRDGYKVLLRTIELFEEGAKQGVKIENEQC